MKKLTQKRVEWIIQQIVRWYRIREENGFEHDPTSPDVDHSSLLRMLLGGEKIYKYPPPRSYSYPNYHAVEHETIPQEIWFKKNKEGFFFDSISLEEVETTDVVPAFVGIDQGMWKVLRREGRNLILQHDKDPAEWVLSPRTEEEIEEAIRNRHSTADEQFVRESFKKRHRWALKRIPPEE